MDRCIRHAAGMEIPGRTMTSVLDAWGGALNNDAAKAVLKAKGTELRIRPRGQRAATIEARSGILRHLLHVMKTPRARLNISLVFTRLLHEAMFAAEAFIFYDEVSPCNALIGLSLIHISEPTRPEPI
eukprot:8018310-Pyramimonas_sp.AAC.1